MKSVMAAMLAAALAGGMATGAAGAPADDPHVRAVDGAATGWAPVEAHVWTVLTPDGPLWPGLWRQTADGVWRVLPGS